MSPPALDLRAKLSEIESSSEKIPPSSVVRFVAHTLASQGNYLSDDEYMRLLSLALAARGCPSSSQCPWFLAIPHSPASSSFLAERRQVQEAMRFSKESLVLYLEKLENGYSFSDFVGILSPWVDSIAILAPAHELTIQQSPFLEVYDQLSKLTASVVCEDCEFHRIPWSTFKPARDARKRIVSVNLDGGHSSAVADIPVESPIIAMLWHYSLEYSMTPGIHWENSFSFCDPTQPIRLSVVMRNSTLLARRLPSGAYEIRSANGTVYTGGNLSFPVVSTTHTQYPRHSCGIRFASSFEALKSEVRDWCRPQHAGEHAGDSQWLESCLRVNLNDVMAEKDANSLSGDHINVAVTSPGSSPRFPLPHGCLFDAVQIVVTKYCSHPSCANEANVTILRAPPVLGVSLRRWLMLEDGDVPSWQHVCLLPLVYFDRDCKFLHSVPGKELSFTMPLVAGCGITPSELGTLRQQFDVQLPLVHKGPELEVSFFLNKGMQKDRPVPT